MPTPNPQQVARAGELFVAAELNRRGAYAVIFTGNMPEIDILASNQDQSRTVALQVKTKRTGTWQATRKEWTERLPEVAQMRFWVLVDLKPSFRTAAAEEPTLLPYFYVVPEAWMQRDITRRARGRNPATRLQAIAPNRVAEWWDRWDILGIT